MRLNFCTVLSFSIGLLAVAAKPARAQSNYATPYTFTTLAGSSSLDGTGSAARFYNPNGVAVDGSGNVYVADTFNCTIRKITAGGVVTTLAGTAGSFGSADGEGSKARFSYPRGVAVDGSGNVYVADSGNATIRKITAGGVVTTLAGAVGVYGSADGTGSAAQFGVLNGVAVDGSGNVYATDSTYNTIRKITAGGVVTTLAGAVFSSGSVDGTGSAAQFNGPSGVAVDGSGNVYVGDQFNHTIRKITAGGLVTTLAGTAGGSGSKDGTGSAARFNGPAGVVVDGSGNVYVADQSNHTIRKVTAGGVVTTLAGTAGNFGSEDGTGSAARFNYPAGVAVDESGNVYVADQSNHTIRKITAGGVVTTLAGTAGISTSRGSANGTGSAARFNNPSGVAVDGSGNVYVADLANNTIRKITAGGVVTTLAGLAGSGGSADGKGNAAPFNNPRGVAVDGSGNVYVADSGNNTIRKITAGGVVTTLAGTAGSSGSAEGTGSAARFNNPSGVAVDGSGNVYVADTFNHTIRKITVGGGVTTLAGSTGNYGSEDVTGIAAKFNYPSGVAVDGSGNVYVADSGNNTIRKITAGGGVTTLAGLAGSYGSADWMGNAARFYRPNGVAVDGSGSVYVADTANHAIRKITASGLVTTVAGGGTPGSYGNVDGTGSAALLYEPTGVAVERSGNVYVADRRNNTIRKGSPPTPMITSSLTPKGIYGGAVSYSIKASNAPNSYAAAGLPPGITINTVKGTITGTPSQAGTFSVTLSATNGFGAGTATAKWVIAKAPLTVTADAQSRLAEAANPVLTAAITGFVNGDTIAAISGAPVLSTTADTTSLPGSYPITTGLGTLTATNYAFTAVNGVLTVSPLTFADWKAGQFTADEQTKATTSGPTADPDGDGVSNLLEYALGLGPKTSDATGQPVVGVAGGALTLTYMRRKDAGDLTYTVEVSPDLITWVSGPSQTQETSVTSVDAFREQVVVTDLTLMGGATKRFMRLRVN